MPERTSNTVTHAPQGVSKGTRRPKDYFGLVLRGYIMGSADVVPGVSGGTMALILGIYEELIESIRAIGRPRFLRAVFSLRLRAALEALNWKFLAAVGFGILLAIFTLARGLEWLLVNQPVLLWSFFFGLILASVITVRRRVRQWNPATFLALVLGAAGSYTLVGLVPATTPDALWFIFLSGAVMICAMILPGISGAFILVLLGKYQFVLSAVNDRDFLPLIVLISGAAVGIVSFAQLLGWLFRRFHDTTIALLVGIMLGSLRKIWPWKTDPSYIVDELGVSVPVLQRNVLPPLYVGDSLNLEILYALGFAVLGLVVVLLFEVWATPRESHPQD